MQEWAEGENEAKIIKIHTTKNTTQIIIETFSIDTELETIYKKYSPEFEITIFTLHNSLFLQRCSHRDGQLNSFILLEIHTQFSFRRLLLFCTRLITFSPPQESKTLREWPTIISSLFPLFCFFLRPPSFLLGAAFSTFFSHFK